MHLRFRNTLGLPIFAEEIEEVIGTVSGILIHPDTGHVEGFFVEVRGFFFARHLFLSSYDVLHIGTRIIVREAEVLSPMEDRVRLQPLIEDRRTILGQEIRTEGGLSLGHCRDVQFDTLHFIIEWIFPKRFFRWGVPLPVSSIVEVRKDGIIVRDPPKQKKAEEKEQEPSPILKPLPDMA